MLHLRMRTVEPNHWPSWFHLRGENRNPMVFPWSTDLAHFSSFFHAFSISRVSFLGWVFLILGAKLEHFEAQLWWPPRLRWRPPVRLTSSKKEPGVELERDRTDIKCIYNNNHKIIIIMHNNNNNTNIYIIIMMRIRILITLIIINNILYYIYKYNIIKYNIIFASKKNTTSFHYLAAFFLVVFIVFSSLKSAMSFWVWLYIWFTTVFVGDIPILSQVLNLANPPTLTAPIQLRNL